MNAEAAIQATESAISPPCRSASAIVFADPSLLARALTHVSALAPGPAQRRVESYQRLEFLGDRVLGLAVSDMLCAAFPDAEEGELSRRLADLVRKETCADVARDWGVGEVVRLGEGEAQTGGAQKGAILGDICESILGAVFLDGGFPAAREHGAALLSPTRCAIPAGPCAIPRPPCRNGRRRAACRRRSYRQSGRSGRITRRFSSWRSASTALRPAIAEGSSKRFAEQASAQKFWSARASWEEGE